MIGTHNWNEGLLQSALCTDETGLKYWVRTPYPNNMEKRTQVWTTMLLKLYALLWMSPFPYISNQEHAASCAFPFSCFPTKPPPPPPCLPSQPQTAGEISVKGVVKCLDNLMWQDWAQMLIPFSDLNERTVSMEGAHKFAGDISMTLPPANDKHLSGLSSHSRLSRHLRKNQHWSAYKPSLDFLLFFLFFFSFTWPTKIVTTKPVTNNTV